MRYVSKIVGIIEIAVGLIFIIKIATHTATVTDLLVFAAITFAFGLAVSRRNMATSEERSKNIRKNARLDYDPERMAQMRAELEASRNEDGGFDDEEDYHYVKIDNVQEMTTAASHGLWEEELKDFFKECGNAADGHNNKDDSK